MIKVIIADDEKTIRDGLKKLLTLSNLRIDIRKTVSNGLEALKEIKDIKPQIVLMDINMPGMTGLDVIESAKEVVPHAKFIIISGHDDFEYARRAVQLGAFDYILKPIRRDNLVDVVKRAVEVLEKQQLELGLPTPIRSETSTSIVKKALLYMEENYRDCEISLSKMANQFHISQSYLTRIIKKEIDMSFSEYLIELRMKKAMSLLKGDEDIMVGQIAEMIGYSSHHYFSRVFKLYTGLSPLEYRQQCHN